jgi:hypothetical protein
MVAPRVIAVTAPSRRSGKGTISSLLVRDYGYTQFSFALPIKTMFIALCMHAEIPQSLYPRILDGDLKEAALPEVGWLSLRSFAEGVGTSWGRNMVDPDLWVNIGCSKIEKMLGKGQRVVMDDVRFVNEANVARSLGGEVWSVVRPLDNGGLRPTLASEGHLKGYEFDGVFANIGDVSDLEHLVRFYMDRGKTAQQKMRDAGEDV